MVEDDEKHRGAAEEDGEAVEGGVGDHCACVACERVCGLGGNAVRGKRFERCDNLTVTSDSVEVGVWSACVAHGVVRETETET